MSFEERNDFFVERKQKMIQMTKEPIHLIFAKLKDNDFDKQEFDYICDNDHRTNANISRVRIPALVYLKDPIQSPMDYMKLFQYYKKRVGAHLFANFEGKLGSIKAHLDSSNRYHVSKAKFINDVYPCFTFVAEEHQMCIGLRFTSNLKEGNRSFGRTQDRQNPSGGVFDLTENFLDPHRIKSGLESYQNRKLFPRGEHHFAIYVCCGAKLIVEDDRFDVIQKKADSKVGAHKNRSLFQSGSIVIFSAQLLLDLSISLNNENFNSNEIKKVTYEWKEAEKAGILKPALGLYQEWFTERRLHQSNEQIIFLGYNNSEHNSICWRLKIQSPKEKGPTYARLIAPDGGRIVDIQDWNWGMAEIYWRHRYERLYEKVLLPKKPESYIQKTHFNFIIPDIGGKTPYYWQRKILGVGVNFNSWTIRVQYRYGNKLSTVVSPYFDQYTQMVTGIRPFAQSLYPPIYSDSDFKYLPFKSDIKFLEHHLVEIDGQEYKIVFKENVDEYLWTDPKRVSILENTELSADHRIGVDLLVYTKQNSIIGKKSLIYLQSNQNQTKSSEIIENNCEKDSKTTIKHS